MNENPRRIHDFDSRVRRWRIALAASIVLALGLVLVGWHKISDGWVGIRASDPETAISPGWHWAWPGAHPILVPRKPQEQTIDIELPGSLSVTARLHGSFFVPVGAETAWLAANGTGDFEGGLRDLLRTNLRTAWIRPTVVDLIEGRPQRALLASAKESLRMAGIEWSNLTVDLSPEENSLVLHGMQAALTAGRTEAGRKVLVIGWDGADWQLVQPLLAAGMMPNLQRLVDIGLDAELRSEQPMLSPILWTTLATGKSPTEHGITDFVTRHAATGDPVPVTSRSRKVHALWNIVGAAGLDVDVVGWWATWPAEAVKGTIVSDRVAPQLFETTARIDDGGLVYPAERWSPLRRLLTEAEDVPCHEVQRFVDITCVEFDQRWKSQPTEKRIEDPVNHLRKIIATTRSYHAMALALLERQSDLTMLYYEGSDTVAHLFAKYLPPQLSGVAAADVSRFGEALPKFYVYLDELLGELLSRIDLAETAVLLVSDHGFHSGEARPESGSGAPFGATASHWHRLFGVLVAAGSGVAPQDIETANLYDLAPTVLALLGLPVPRDLAGAALFGGNTDAVVELASVEGLPRMNVPRIEVSATDSEQRLRELAALGYIDASPAVTRPDPDPLPPGSSLSVNTVKGAREAYNLGAIHLRSGDLDAARAEFVEAIQIDGSFAAAYLALADLERRRGHPGEAFETLRTGLSRSESIPAAGLPMLVEAAAEAGRLAEAGEALAALHGRVGEIAPYHSAIGLARERFGRPEAALESYQRALTLDPLDSLALTNSIHLMLELEEPAEARQLFDRALEQSSGELNSLNHLGIIALQSRWFDEAEMLFRKVLDSDPGNPGVLSNLASVLLQQDKTKEAVELLQRSVQRNPTDAQNWFNLGAAHARMGDSERALRQFEEAERLGLRDARLFLAQSALLAQLGRRSEAQAKLENAQRLDPDHPGVGALQTQLGGGA